MRTIQAIIAISLLSVFVQWVLPWWTLALVAFVIGYIANQRSIVAFITGFLGIGIIWWGYAAYKHLHTQGILTNKITALLHFPNNWSLILITGFIGALVGGLAAFTGKELRQLM